MVSHTFCPSIWEVRSSSHPGLQSELYDSLRHRHCETSFKTDSIAHSNSLPSVWDSDLNKTVFVMTLLPLWKRNMRATYTMCTMCTMNKGTERRAEQ